MSTNLLLFWSMESPVLHTAVDDLESFLWVLVWTLIHIFKQVAIITNERAIILVLDHIFSSHHIMDLCATRENGTKRAWPDHVFDGLIQDWLTISQQSQNDIYQLEAALLDLGDDDMESLKGILDDLDKCCRGVYKSFIEVGYNHLSQIRKFSTWKEVVDFNGKLLNK